MGPVGPENQRFELDLADKIQAGETSEDKINSVLHEREI